MVHLIVSVSRFSMLFMIAIYTYYCFATLKKNISERRQTRLYKKQTTLMYGLLINANLVLYLVMQDIRVLGLCLCEILLFAITLLIYQKIYAHASKALVNNMCMLLAISFLILTRLDIDKAIKQFAFAGVAVVITCFVPILVAKLKVWDKLGFLYGLIGIGGLAFVCLAASTTYGAKLSISIGPVVLQPSEFIKILFIFFSACMLYKSTEFHHVVKVTILAALHVLILVASRDLGGALIYLITYLVMLYVASRKPIYMVLGLGSGALASVVAYHLFAHVRDRVIAWKDPLSVIDDQGYQISQSLFAIGSGGWFGVGLGQGMPDKIPVVKTDFVFSAIAEEFGVVFAICIIFICISCFLMFFNISMQVKDIFYKLIALGIGTLYGTQVFLALGGVTKFIPSTGVTLPLVSYGGSSLLSTIILFAIIQGLYVMQVDEGESDERMERARKKRR
ncbi:FtsW/RodA/SpoVE family cell cycle protein [Roseburia sp. AM51-8]|uniref:FtsW/RodA/SpoVE family cell cycle protein n=1 Tax=unclassified Roseburia TaxID=2637578 RepID=UPI000E4F29CC|nr:MULTISPECIES: FtsW/RodA/SpoVE family cell cycle protein [unclassified Roseburia]RHO32140.1 FtsW/RodA/SpoVE family cell cycle protein [Roseburia sp. AM16-25]RHQ02451.1 FtsW/RodA/SpoVE family cell cycle protein [Roseburia sp. AM51-8]